MSNSSNVINEAIEVVQWADIRNHVQKVNESLFKIIEEIDPGKKFPLFKITYRYGTKIVNRGSFYVPLNNQQLTPVYDPRVPKFISEKLNYCAIPLTLLLNKSSEVFTETQQRVIPLQYLLPGQLFGLFEALSPQQYHPNDPKPIWSVSSGARSVFMLPKISDNICHGRLKRELQLHASPPKNLSDHWAIFTEIANNPLIKNQWNSEVLVFPEIWLRKYEKDLGWLKFRNYLLELAWLESQVLREKSTFGYLWESLSSTVMGSLRTKPYFIDTIQHLIFISTGARPGFRNTMGQELAFPTKTIEEVYINSYGLNYPPIILQPDRLTANNGKIPVYYSFNYPTLLHSAIEIGKPRRTLPEMHEVTRLMEIIGSKIKTDLTAATMMLRNITYDYFHSEKDPYGIINPSKNIIDTDKSWAYIIQKFKDREFPATASFLRGCVSISLKYN